MSLKKLFLNLPLKLKFQNVTVRRYWGWKSSDNILDSAEEKPVFVDENEVDTIELERKRNKSGLSPAHRNILNGRRPYDEPLTHYHNTVRYKKRMLGRYGIESLEVPAGLAWPTPSEVEKIKEYEKFVFPLTIQERLSKIKEKKRLREESIMARQQQIATNMVNMEKMITDIQEKVNKKEALLLKAQQEKQAKIDEIRSKLLAEGKSTDDDIEKALIKMYKEEKKQKKEARKAKILEKQVEFAKKLLEAEQENEANKNVEESKADKD